MALHYSVYQHGLNGLLACVLCVTHLSVNAQNCQIKLQPATVDYGTLTRAGIVANQASQPLIPLGQRLINIHIVCQQPTQIALLARGLYGTDGFAFGNNGQFTVNLSNAVLDGVQVNLMRSPNATDAASTVLLNPGVKVMPFAAGNVLSGSSLSMQALINTGVTDASTKVREMTIWDGQVIFELTQP